MNADNNANFNDRNSIIYGHRMKDGSMFRKLDEYKDKSFWEANPYFYIYTPDGREIVYHIYSAATVKDTDDVYLTGFENDEAYQSYLDMTKRIAIYDTGCGSDDCRFSCDTINMYKRQRRAPICSDWSKRTRKSNGTDKELRNVWTAKIIQKI